MTQTARREQVLAVALASCGLSLHGIRRGTGIPPYAAALTLATGPGDGRLDRAVELEALAQANAAWFELGTEAGLFDDRGHFLLSVDDPAGPEPVEDDVPPEQVWAEVELLAGWDLMDAGVRAGVTGIAPYGPAFVMSAVDGSVFVQGTVWEQVDRIGIAALPKPWTVHLVRDVVQRNLGKHYRSAAEQADAEAWLAAGH